MRFGEIVYKVRKEEFILGMVIVNCFIGCLFGMMVIGYKIIVRCKNIKKILNKIFL